MLIFHGGISNIWGYIMALLRHYYGINNVRVGSYTPTARSSDTTTVMIKQTMAVLCQFTKATFFFRTFHQLRDELDMSGVFLLCFSNGIRGCIGQDIPNNLWHRHRRL